MIQRTQYYIAVNFFIRFHPFPVHQLAPRNLGMFQAPTTAFIRVITILCCLTTSLFSIFSRAALFELRLECTLALACGTFENAPQPPMIVVIRPPLQQPMPMSMHGLLCPSSAMSGGVTILKNSALLLLSLVKLPPCICLHS